MHIGILIFTEPSQEGPAGADRLIEEAKKAGHDVSKIYAPFLAYSHNGKTFQLSYEGLELRKFDMIIARPNFIEEPSLHVHIPHLFQRVGIPVMNGDARGYMLCKNKIAQHIRFTEEGIPMPRWTITRSTKEALLAAKRMGFPVILKTAFGTIGKGVFYAESAESLRPITDYLAIRDGNPIIVEEFIRKANRKDIRVFILNGKIVAAMERTAKDGDVRSNVGQGGSSSLARLSEAERVLALRAAQVCKLDIAGVDLLRSNRGPLIIEVNANPGFKELEKVTGVNIAQNIIEVAVQKV